MYFNADMVAAAERTYGLPATCRLSYDVTPRELALIRTAQVKGRKHDVTLAIFGPPGIIVVARPWYPHGLYRIPSGGLRPGETLEAGAAREAAEEAQVEVSLVAYHLRIDVDFVGAEATVPWTSHVFSARYRGGDVRPQDTDEIREARWCPLPELRRHGELMRRSRVSGFHYRAALQDRLLDLLRARGWVEDRSGEPVARGPLVDGTEA